LSLPTLKPNLAPYIPAGWSDKIVVSKTTGTNTDNSPLYATDALYVDWAVTNNGSVSTSTGFSVALYVDGIIRNSWNSDPVSVDYYTYINDYSIGPLGAGTHTVKIVSDSTGMINERDEGDNEYTKTITVLPMPIVEFVSTPAIPDGATTVNSGSSYAYSTGGSSSSLGHPIQYFLDWGDGSNSGWLPAGTTSAQKAWSTPGTYLVKAQARCATHTSVVSGWSVTLSVTISETVGFNDVSASHWAYNQIMAIYHEGITGGCSTNPMMYCPDAHITRAQMAVFMETSLGRTPAASCNGTFSDVDAGTVGDVVCRFIEDFAAAGITGDAEEEGFVLMTQ
jgi:hypothetical protein